MVLKNGTVLTGDFEFKKLDVHINGDKISRFEFNAQEDKSSLDVSGMYVIPGLIDVHTHGMGGIDATVITPDKVKKLSSLYVKNGITSFLPTTVTADIDTLKSAVSAIASEALNVNGARILGINMEGPYLGPERAGAHDKSLLKDPDIDEVRYLQKHSKGLLKIVNIAPELPGAMGFISELKDEFVLSVAHTNADYQTVSRAINSGARHATHLFNAMSPFTHREPGAVGAILDSTATTAEIIAEPNHLHAAALRMAFKLLGPGRAVFISDSIAATGLPDGEYFLGGENVKVSDGVARTGDGTLAGSTCTLLQDVQHAADCGIPIELAVKAATLNPATLLSVDKITGSLAVGKLADLVILNKSFEVERVILGGQIINKGLL